MNKTILALDVFDFKKAEKLVKDLSPYIDIFKVGPILFLQCGKEIIKMINDNGKKVFLDLKFYDIPATVQRAVQSAKDLGIYSLTVHSCGGQEMLKLATSVENKPKIWAVTVLTSQVTTTQEVLERAKLAKDCGVDGVISSPLEIEAIKLNCGKDFEVITPGIRPVKVNDDQKRVATPETAIKSGANFIVVGRPIIQAENPVEVAKNIYESVKSIKN